MSCMNDSCSVFDCDVVEAIAPNSLINPIPAKAEATMRKKHSRISTPASARIICVATGVLAGIAFTISCGESASTAQAQESCECSFEGPVEVLGPVEVEGTVSIAGPVEVGGTVALDGPVEIATGAAVSISGQIGPDIRVVPASEDMGQLRGGWVESGQIATGPLVLTDAHSLFLGDQYLVFIWSTPSENSCFVNYFGEITPVADWVYALHKSNLTKNRAVPSGSKLCTTAGTSFQVLGGIQTRVFWGGFVPHT